MKRTVIKIDEALCNGCGACISGCHEGALQLIGGKAMMVSDLYCDGLGACIGECPVGAITFEEREAEPYDQTAVLERLAAKGEEALLAHLRHLRDHGADEWFAQGLRYLEAHGMQELLEKLDPKAVSDAPVIGISAAKPVPTQPLACGCPGSAAREIPRSGLGMAAAPAAPRASELRHFPVQLHLVNPQAGFFKGSDLLLAADCTAFACGDFHRRLLRGKSLAIACPKLDSNLSLYVDKLVQLIDTAHIDTLTVVVMEVPCCQGLVRIAQAARGQAARNVPLKVVVVSVAGDIMHEKWV